MLCTIRTVFPILFFMAVGMLSAQNSSITLTSLEWPPYTSESLVSQGATAAVVTAAFKAEGYTLNITFVPWERAVDMAKNSPKVSGYFPEYYSKDNEADFTYSAPIGTGPLGFVERKDAPVKWSSLEDLKPLVIGVVEGYFNTVEFDSLVASKALKTDRVVDDATNVVKVANKRIPLAVIDANVLQYLVTKDKVALPYKDTVQFNARLLEMKSLFVCFKKGPEGNQLAAVLNAGLKKINAAKIMKDYFDANLK